MRKTVTADRNLQAAPGHERWPPARAPSIQPARGLSTLSRAPEPGSRAPEGARGTATPARPFSSCPSARPMEPEPRPPQGPVHSPAAQASALVWHLSPNSRHSGVGFPGVPWVLLGPTAGWQGWPDANTAQSRPEGDQLMT